MVAGAGGAGDAGVALPVNPVFEAQAGEVDEVAGVARDEGEVMGESSAADEEVEIAPLARVCNA